MIIFLRISLIFFLSLVVSCSTIKTQNGYRCEIEELISSLRGHAINKECGSPSKLCVIKELSFSIGANIVIKTGGEKVILFGHSNMLQHSDSRNRALYWNDYAVTEKSQKNNKVISDFFIKVGNHL